MQFLLFDVVATLVFLFGYLTVVALRRRALPVVMGASRALSRQTPPTTPQPRREWPRLSHPR